MSCFLLVLNSSNFWSQVNKTDTCWIWQGYKNHKGYGELYQDGKKWIAHRLSYTLIKGPIDPGLTIDHLCLNESCVNPDHLEAVTNEENLRRKQRPEDVKKRGIELRSPEWHQKHLDSLRRTKAKRLRILENIRRINEEPNYIPDPKLPTTINFQQVMQQVLDPSYPIECNCVGFPHERKEMYAKCIYSDYTITE